MTQAKAHAEITHTYICIYSHCQWTTHVIQRSVAVY